MRPLPLIIFLLAIAATALPQVEPSHKPSQGLDSGLVLAHQETIPLGKPETTLHRTDGAPVELTDFSLSFALQLAANYQGKSEARFFSLNGESGSLAVSIDSPNRLQLRLGSLVWQAQPMKPLAGRRVAVTLSVKKDVRQSLAGLWVDGVEMHSLRVPPGTLRLNENAATCGSQSLTGSVSHLRLYSRALDRSDIISLAVRSGSTPDSPLPPIAPTAVEFLVDETVAVVGGSEAVALLEDGLLEALLLTDVPQKRLKLRSLAWETDTVWRQDRPLNFGDLPQQLKRVNATTIMVMFGRQECLERGTAGLASFTQELTQLVESCRRQTPRIILVAPICFENGTPPLPDLRPLNVPLRGYQQAILDLAKKYQLPVVPPPEKPAEELSLTSDGITLTVDGTHHWAGHIATVLAGPNAHAAVAPPQVLLASIRDKNRLWHEYWRPSNWAFLYGDRTSQPSSRDHLNPQVRWFPAELEKYRSMIETQEQEIWQQAAELERRVP